LRAPSILDDGGPIYSTTSFSLLRVPEFVLADLRIFQTKIGQGFDHCGTAPLGCSEALPTKTITMILKRDARSNGILAF
jgi:hypothetical protein